MKKLSGWFWLILTFAALSLPSHVALGATPELTHDVLAHGAGDLIWFAKVTKAGDTSMMMGPAYDHTDAYVRQSGPGQTWQDLPTVSGRAVGIASQSSQLVLLMNDGKWFTVGSDGSATGQPLPADGKILAIADDGKNLWAAGLVSGGRTAADTALAREAAATQPSNDPSKSTTLPVNNSLFSKLVDATSTVIAQNRIVVFRQETGRWITVAELPSDVSALTQEGVALAVPGGSPVVSFKFKSDKETIRTLRLVAGEKSADKWVDVASLQPSDSAPADDFELLDISGDPVLWWTHGLSPGELFFDSDGKIRSVKLDWKGANTLDGPPTVTYAGGFIRVMGLHGKEVIEQRFEITGEAVGVGSSLSTPVDINETRIPLLIQTLFLVAVAFSVCASIWHWSKGQSTQATVVPPPPAPLTGRLGAGLVDLIPVLAALIILAVTDPSDGVTSPSVGEFEILMGAVLLYLLHTTLVECLTGRTIGKRLFGLRVLSVDGKKATTGQILTRNLLRVIDPLVMILASALRQRSADVVAGTMVVRADEVNPKPGDEQPPVDSPGKESK